MKKLSKILTFFLLIAAFLLVSCKDDLVSPPPQSENNYDSARFKWVVDTLNNTMAYNIYIPDTNNIYLLNDIYQLVHYNGSQYYYYNLQYGIWPVTLSGYDYQHVYIGGYANVNNSYYQLKMLLWNGFSFQNIPIPDSSTTKYYIGAIFARNLNELWLGTNKGKLFKYDGTNFTRYFIDSNYSVNPNINFFELGSNLYCSASRLKDTLPLSTTDTISIFKFNGVSWERAYSISDLTENRSTFGFIGSNLYIYQFYNSKYALYRFTGNNLIMIQQIGPFYPFSSFGGLNENSYIISGYEPSNLQFYLYQWNGRKWSQEVTHSVNTYIYYVKGFEKRFFCIGSRHSVTYVFRGKLK